VQQSSVDIGVVWVMVVVVATVVDVAIAAVVTSEYMNVHVFGYLIYIQ